VTDRPDGLTAALLTLVAVSFAFAPEAHGAAQAGVAALAMLAAILASPRVAHSRPAMLIFAVLPALAIAVRGALSPGAAVEPVALLVIAAVAGIAATATPSAPRALGPILVGFTALVACRALYEAIWGLSALADSARAAGALPDAAAVVNRLEQGRPYAGFVTPAALGGYFALTLPAVVLWAAERRGWTRWAGFAAGALGAAGLAATRSVTALGALAVGLGLAALRRRVPGRVIAGLSAAIALAILAAGLTRPDALFSPTRGDSPWRLRAGNIRVALEIGRQHPWAGAGPGGFAEAFPQHRREGDNESRHAHDLPAELIAEWGIPCGLALSAIFLLTFLAPLFHGATRGVEGGLAIGLAAFAAHNLVDFTAFLPSLFVPAAVLRGWLAPRPVDAPVAARPARRVAWSATAAVAAFAWAASGLAKDALFEAREAAVVQDHSAALAAAIRAERLASWSADAAQFAASARIASGGGDAGLAAAADADRAVALAPVRASARGVRADIRMGIGDAPGAYADLACAARLYPLRTDYARRRDALAEEIAKASSRGKP
jgi:hypothetical protein